MTGLLRARWQGLLDGFWLVPGAVAAGTAGLSFVLVEIDRATGEVGLAFGGDAGAARDILATIAGSLITVAGLTFSLTIVILALISSQYTPRAVRSFLADRVNQVVAGAFVGIFAYCLLVLRTVRGSEDGGGEFVPALSVTVAIGLGLVTLALLLVYIHRLGQSIQASHVTARIARQTLEALDRLYPDRYGRALGEDPDDTLRAWLEEGDPASVTSPRPGYVQLIDLDALAQDAPAGARLHVSVRPGDFVTENDTLVRIWPAEAVRDRGASIRQGIPIAAERDLRQDASYGLRQLSDIALKALSPGINDPTTAVVCISYLRAALERLAGRTIPASVRQLGEGAALVAETRSFEEYLDSAFSEIGRYASDNARVVVALLAALRSIACAVRQAEAPERLPVLIELGEAITAAAVEAAATTRDEELLLRELGRLREEVSRV